MRQHELGLPILLDTCALIWIASGANLSIEASRAINETTMHGNSLAVSPISAWEIGLLASKGRLPATISPAALFEGILARPQVRLAPMPPLTLIAASFLPGPPHGDPADRILIATAREHSFRIMTRDRLILAYAATGHVSAIPC